jgi:PleD family two-component response regulator
VFGRHAADTCLRRVGSAVRRCLRRASDVVGRLDGEVIAVLSHATDEESVRGFASRIATAVRELGLHHPRSGKSRFVTISYRVEVAPDPGQVESASRFLDALLAKPVD